MFLLIICTKLTNFNKKNLCPILKNNNKLIFFGDLKENFTKSIYNVKKIDYITRIEN